MGVAADGGMRRGRRGTLWFDVAAYICALALLAVSFAGYASRFTTAGRWQADNYDPADYRYVAEYFWHVPIVPETYDGIWGGPWGTYLQMIPFRTIGLGTGYLMAGWATLGHAPQTPAEVAAAGLAFATLEKLLLAAALLTLFAVVRQWWGTALALAALAITAFPSDVWRISDDFLTEPVHRILFLLAFACTVAMRGKRWTVWLAFAVTAIWILATQVKVQWYVGAALLLPALLFQFWRARVRLTTAVWLCLATAFVPLSVIGVNWIGWRNTSLNPGVGMHLNLRYDEALLPAFSRATAGDPNRPPFADLDKPRLRWWLLYIGPETTREQYEAFDRFGQQYLRQHSGSALRHFWEGLRAASTYPGIERVEQGRIRLEPLDEPWRTIVRTADILTWVLLFAGLAFHETRLPCALALVLWIVPALGTVASLYELRYHLPMAGLGAIAALLVVTRMIRGSADARVDAGA